MKLIASWLINALALYIVDYIVSGISFDRWQTLLVAALVIGIINSLIKPVAHLIALPITLLTLGIFALIVNTAMLALAAVIVPGFTIAGFWSAFFGAILLSIVSTFLHSMIREDSTPLHE